MTVEPTQWDLLVAAGAVIRALADERDFLGLQLSRACGIGDPAQHDALVEQYLSAPTAPDAAERVCALLVLAPDLVDCDFVAAVCRCDVDVAAGLIRAAVRGDAPREPVEQVPKLAPRGVRYAAVMKYDERIQRTGTSDRPDDSPGEPFNAPWLVEQL